jgi:hypothetical protein
VSALVYGLGGPGGVDLPSRLVTFEAWVRSGKWSIQGGERLVRLSVPEVQKLLLKLVRAFVPPVERVPAWSVWRRHQHRARECHYKKHRAKPPD